MFDLGSNVRYLCNQRGFRMRSRVLREQPVHVREDDKKIRIHQVGDLSRKGVIVAETDLIHRHRVIFIDDGDHVQFEQRRERVPCIEKAFAIGQVFMGEQHLGNGSSGFLKTGFIGVNQPALSG